MRRHEVKIQIPFPAGFKPGYSAETVWAEVLGEGLFRLENEPLNPHLRYHDIVCAKPTLRPGFYEFLSLSTAV